MDVASWQNFPAHRPLWRSPIPTTRSTITAQKDRMSRLGIALIYTAQGNSNQTFKWLEEGVAKRATAMVQLAVDPDLLPLHSDPAFSGLLRRMNLSD